MAPELPPDNTSRCAGAHDEQVQREVGGPTWIFSERAEAAADERANSRTPDTGLSNRCAGNSGHRSGRSACVATVESLIDLNKNPS